MSTYRDDLARVEKEILDVERERNRLSARLEGLKAERDALEKLNAGMDDHGSIADLTKADAMVKILKESSTPMSLGEIADAMTTAGKKTNKNGASVYIDGLLKSGRVARVSRNQYRAA
ncbi:hypothetical protein [Streptomyces sp. NPDC057748]|uniref:hypothetical protein n=1 Tax=unclassified Streptomyces TaxID=2593676 RepID=UPI0036896AEE